MIKPRPNIAIVGATGVVGREMLDVLHQRGFDHGEIRLLASSRSAGSTQPYGSQTLTVQELREDAFDGIDLVLLALSSDLSRVWSPRCLAAGATVIDNSSAYRMDASVPLVVPEINGDVLAGWDRPGIIANPNCSTIIALMAVTPIYRAVGVDRMVVSTYQAASGGGLALLQELEGQAEDHVAGRPYRQQVLDRPYLFNVFSHESPIGPDGRNTEETKLVRETHKIWNDDSTAITATCVRVPVLRAHAEAINLTLASPLSEEEARELLRQSSGVQVVDDRDANRFPEPALASGGDDVLVGRIRSDHSQPAGLGLDIFACGDQLRKGAALNAIQIAEKLCQQEAAVAASTRPAS